MCLELIGKDGVKKEHYFKITGYNGVPRIDIDVEEPIVSKESYVDAKIKIYNCTDFGIVDTICKVRGRGHTSWTFSDKKSYKIKLQKKCGALLGITEDKEYCLLAEIWDKSLLRWGYMFEVAKALRMPFVPMYKHVELFINNEYEGVYMLTEQIERSDNKVMIDRDGFMVERDSYYYTEPLYFITNVIKEPMSFKYPDASDGDVREGDDNYNFITAYFDKVESTLKAIESGSKDYQLYIDLNSFVKWYISEELLGNIDPNKYFVLRNRASKLEMGPVWDADWSMGNASMINGCWEKPPYQPTIDEVVCNVAYLQYLLKDKDFCDTVRREWGYLKPFINAILQKMEEEAKKIEYAQIDNFVRWPILNTYLGCGLIALGSWEAEVAYVNDYFVERAKWFDQYVLTLGLAN